LTKRHIVKQILKRFLLTLSDKNPEPENAPNGSNLIVIVKTDWEQMQFSTNCTGSGMSGGNNGADEYDYHFARFYRRGENAFFIYNSTLKTSKLKDVIMKGNKIFRNGQWQEPWN